MIEGIHQNELCFRQDIFKKRTINKFFRQTKVQYIEKI